jgi:hypothetical protein
MATAQELIRELDDFMEGYDFIRAGGSRSRLEWAVLRAKIVAALASVESVDVSRFNPDDNTRKDLAEGYEPK